MNTTAFASNDFEKVEPRGVYIRECVDYEPNHMEINYTHHFLGLVSGNNTQGSTPMVITYVYEETDGTDASIGGYLEASAEVKTVFAKMTAKLGVQVLYTREWTKGTQANASYSIPPGNFEVLKVYIPAVKTSGLLKYKVYMDTYPENIFYEYKTLTESYAPMKNSVHYEVVSVSNSTY